MPRTRGYKRSMGHTFFKFRYEQYNSQTMMFVCSKPRYHRCPCQYLAEEKEKNNVTKFGNYFVNNCKCYLHFNIINYISKKNLLDVY